MALQPDNASVNLWDQTWAQVNATFGGQKLQLVYPFMDWTWPQANPGFIDAKAYSVVSQMPKWSAVGKYSPSDKDLYSSYKTVLEQCPKLTTTPEQQQQLKDVQDQINEAKGTLASDKEAMMYAWEQAQHVPEGMKPPEFNAWKQETGWTASLQVDELALQSAESIKAEIVKQQNAKYSEAIEAAALPAKDYDHKEGFLKCNINGNMEWRAGFLVSQGQDWVAELTKGGGTPLTIHMDASKPSSSMKNSWAGGACDYGDCFFGIYMDGSWSDMKLTESDSDIEVDIEIQAVTQVPVRPGKWYDSGYISYLAKKHEWNPPFATKEGESPVFGKGGLLPLMISGLLAGYQISFDITMSAETFKRHEYDFNVAKGIRIGPFHIGGGFSTHSDSWTKTASGCKFSGESNATYPFIIGFTVAEPGIGE